MMIRSYNTKAAHIQQTQPPQLIFAVMASPDVLRKTGRNSESPEQMNLVELMCEFVEAMNPTIILSKWVTSFVAFWCFLWFYLSLLLLRRKPEILKDRDLAGELKDVWTAVQNFRDKEKAFSSGGQDIVVYTEFGPDSGQPIHRNEPNNEKPVKSEIHEASKLDQQQQQQLTDTQIHTAKDEVEENVAEKEKCEEVLAPESVESESETTPSIEIDKLSLGGGDKKVNSKNNENHLNNESSEKIVKIQNQKNKDSHFFPKFLSSSKEKEAKDKDKDKEKAQQDEPEPKSKTKKSFFSLKRNKSQSSPTHTASNNNLNNQKSDSEH